MSDNDQFATLLAQEWPELPDLSRKRIVEFRRRVVEENGKQNLTRLLSPQDFYEGHVLDVREFLKSGWCEGYLMDLGSGAGVPGLLSAILSDSHWVLADSEASKAAFLSQVVQEFDLADRVVAFPGRGELLPANVGRADTIVARAVGPITRIYGWFRDCSTWNTMILFKGRGWDAEWADFGVTKYRSELMIVDQHTYRVGTEQKERVIVRLGRVPRGTLLAKRNR